MSETNDTTTRHVLSVQIERDDRDHPIEAGTITLEGEDFDAFDEAAARKRLIELGHLGIGSDFVTFGDTMVPSAKLDRIRVTITGKSRPRTPEEEVAYQETLAKRAAATT